MLNGAAAVRADLRQKLGTDLTVSCSRNPFWKTGNAVKVSKKNIRTHQPWEDVKRVAEGRCAGKDRADPEAWNDYVNRVISDQLFPY